MINYLIFARRIVLLAVAWKMEIGWSLHTYLIYMNRIALPPRPEPSLVSHICKGHVRDTLLFFLKFIHDRFTAEGNLQQELLQYSQAHIVQMRESIRSHQLVENIAPPI